MELVLVVDETQTESEEYDEDVDDVVVTFMEMGKTQFRKYNGSNSGVVSFWMR